jgi:hypothetical protein
VVVADPDGHLWEILADPTSPPATQRQSRRCQSLWRGAEAALAVASLAVMVAGRLGCLLARVHDHELAHRPVVLVA